MASVFAYLDDTATIRTKRTKTPDESRGKELSTLHFFSVK